MLQNVIVTYLTIFSLFCYGMEQETLFDAVSFETLYISKITQNKGLLKINFWTDSDQELFHIFSIRRLKNDILGLEPFITSEHELSDTSAREHLFILFAEDGMSENFCKMLDQGIDVTTTDKRLDSLRFVLKNATGKPFTLNDFFHKKIRPWHVTKSNEPIISVHPYTTTYNWTAVDHAYKKMDINILAEINLRNPQLLLDKKIDINALVQQLEKEQLALQDAQKNQSIPTFLITSEKPQMCSSLVTPIASNYDPALLIEATLDKDTCIITQQTSSSTWKYPYLDIDSLATLYSIIISVNDKEGKRLVDLFDHWKKHHLFLDHVLRYICAILTTEKINPLPKNIYRLGEKTLRYISQNYDQETFLVKKFLAFSICFGHTQAFDTKNMPTNKQKKHAYRTYLDTLLKQEYGKTFLKKLCDDNKKALFTPYVKKCIQTRLLKNHCAKILSNGQAPFSECKNIAHTIVELWTPDKKFRKACLPTTNQ